MNQLYDISKYGFMPERCCKILPEKFSFFQEALDNLPETKCNDYREVLARLPKYDVILHNIDTLTDPELKFMYSILCMMTQRYVWCTGVADAKLYAKIPDIIGIPLWQVSQKLGIAISLTYAAVDLWNWSNEGTELTLDNMTVNFSMTGDPSEFWFYKIMNVIEGHGGYMLLEFLRVHQYFNDEARVVDFLNRLKENLKYSTKIIGRMTDHCDPNFFFNKLRIYLSGSKNTNLPDGLQIDLTPVGGQVITLKNSGGSAAQSTLIQVYDALLGIKHDHGNDFLVDMRQYMPKKHRNYLERISELPSLREFVEGSNNEALHESFGAVVKQLNHFRQVHLKLVHRYIVDMVKQAEKDANAHGEKGSGGTDPVEFFNHLIAETTYVRKRDWTMIIIPLIILLAWLWHIFY